MGSLEELAREIMLERNPNMVENFVKIVLFVNDNNEFAISIGRKNPLKFGRQ